MKDNKKMFILIEVVLGLMVLMLALIMIWEKNGEDRMKISVIIQNPDDTQWSAFKYGLKEASEDLNVEVSVVSTGLMRSENQEKHVIEQEVQKDVDAVILQPVPGADLEAMLEGIHVPVILIEHAADAEGTEGSAAVVGPDQAEMGRILAEEVLRDYQGDLTGREIGIFSKTTDLSAVKERERGAREVLERAGAKIQWFVAGDFEEIPDAFLGGQSVVDAVLALDDTSLTRLGKYSADNVYETPIYGIGHSTEAVYCLDTGVAECLLIPDEFNVGYQSVAEVVKKIQRSVGTVQGQKISYKVIRKDTLFSRENQKILFTMSQ